LVWSGLTPRPDQTRPFRSLVPILGSAVYGLGCSAVFGIEEPLSIFSIHIEDIDFLNIDSSIRDSSILRSIEDIENIENRNHSTKIHCNGEEYRYPSPF
jgi:hypothetical protein